LGAVGGGSPSAFSAYYVNAFAPGAPGVSSLSAFNVPIYSGNLQGGGNALGSSSGFPSPFNNASPLGNIPANLSSGNLATAGRRLPSYTAVAAFAYRPAAPNQLQRDVTGVLARSTALSPDREIQVVVEGPVVVLRGTVPSEGDRRLAESLVRLSPGVGDVRNELQVPEPIPQPRPGP